MPGLNRLFGSREIDAWRDDFSLLAAAVLNQAAAGLVASLDAEVGEAGWIDSLIGQSAFIAARVAPLVRTEIDPIAADIMANANAALAVSKPSRWHLQSVSRSSTCAGAAATPAWGDALKRSTDAAKPMVAAMRTREAAATSTTFTLEELDRRQIGGREWLEAARNETDAPFVFMAAG